MYSPSLQGTSAQGRGETSAGRAEAPRGHGPALPGQEMGRKDQLQGERRTTTPQGCLGWRRQGVNSLAPHLLPPPPQERSWFLFSPGSLRTPWHCFLGLQEAPIPYY